MNARKKYTGVIMNASTYILVTNASASLDMKKLMAVLIVNVSAYSNNKIGRRVTTYFCSISKTNRTEKRRKRFLKL